MKAKQDILVMGHRGFRGIAPENTLLAARKAFEAGANWWELDVAASSDGELVVLHDDSLVRTSDAKALFPGRSPWSVYDFSFEELRRLDMGSFYGKTDPFKQVAAGRVGAAELASFKGEKLPTLRECLELTKAGKRKVNIEIKDATGHPCDAWIVERTVELVRELGMGKDVIVSSFNHEYLRRVKKADPSLDTGALVEERPANLVPLLKELRARAYHPGVDTLDEATVREVRAAGFEVNVWTPNEVEVMKRLLSWGVTGLISDFPDRALEVVAARG
jgi:glycerophosphoryl diester phosphodiesterase